MSKMKHISIIIANEIDPIHTRLLQAQKDIKSLKDTAYSEHRLVTKMGEQIKVLTKMVDTLNKQHMDDGK